MQLDDPWGRRRRLQRAACMEQRRRPGVGMEFQRVPLPGLQAGEGVAVDPAAAVVAEPGVEVEEGAAGDAGESPAHVTILSCGW